MSEAIIIASIAALPGILTSLIALRAVIISITKVHILVNSQKDALTGLVTSGLIRIKELEDLLGTANLKLK